MIDRIIEFSIRRRWLVILAALGLAVWGARAATRAPVDAVPDLSENQVIVFTDWPGHGPREIEDQITFPLALRFQGLPEVRVVRSSSEVSFSRINVIFDDTAGWDTCRTRVAEALAGAAGELPTGVTPRLGPDANATGQIFWYAVEGPGYDPGRLRAVQDWFIRPQLASVPGVAEVASVGGAPAEYQVELDPHKLKAFGVAPSQISEVVAKANAAVGGNVVHKANEEFIVRSAGWLGARPGSGEIDPQHIVQDLENVPIVGAKGEKLRLKDVAAIALGAQPRRGVLEKDGNEVTGGVVLMRHGENPREITLRLRHKIEELQAGLPPHVTIVPFYDRTPLIDGAVGAISNTLVEAIIIATVCIFLVLLHVRTSFIIALTLPLSVLASFGLMDMLRRFGFAGAQTNIMSLAGLAISIGVLVDSSIVMAENAMHHLKAHYGDRPVTGDTREIVLPACRTVGRPLFFSVAIMLLSFLPVFALGGLEGKMFHPLAFTKSFALAAMALLSVTLVPALCTLFVKGRLRSEEQVPLVRSLTRIYRPVLAFFLDRPSGLIGFVGLTFIAGLAPLGNRLLLLALLAIFVVAAVATARTRIGKVAVGATLVLAGLMAEQRMHPLGREFIAPLDEGMVMDMPITAPRASVTQAVDDLKARDMVLCRFPEVDMVVGKAGRADSPTDPAPLDMIETMVNFRPPEFWPKRCLRRADAEGQIRAVLEALIQKKIIQVPANRARLADEACAEALELFDAQMREAAYQRNKELERSLGAQLSLLIQSRLTDLLAANGSLHHQATALAPGEDLAGHASHLAMDPSREGVAAIALEMLRSLTEQGAINPANGDPLGLRLNFFEGAVRAGQAALGSKTPGLLDQLHAEVKSEYGSLWQRHVRKLNSELLDRAPGLYTRLALEALLQRAEILDGQVADAMEQWQKIRAGQGSAGHHAGAHHHRGPQMPVLDPLPELDRIQREQTENFARGLLLWPREKSELTGSGGELDRAVQMPGWTNVWTMPIQNRVDMLSTGVNTAIGVRVLGHSLDEVLKTSENIAALLKTLPGAVDVIADPVRGKGYLEIHPRRDKVARLGLNPGAVNDLVEIATGGKVVTTAMEGRERRPIRLRYARAYREDEESLGDLPVLVPGPGDLSHVPLSAVADIRISEGPGTIKGENGLLCNYVRLNVRDRDVGEFVTAAKLAVAAGVNLPPGVFVEWTGQFEHEIRARQTLEWAVPAVVVLIFLVLLWTCRDWADAAILMLTVPGAIAGGVFFQWLFGYPFSVTVWVGYIACFGMATSTGIIMLVYLREAVGKAGGLATISCDDLREAVLQGAVHRLRPKLLTESVTILSLTPLLWATGPGADILHPMVVPVLGGILIADEVIDLFLPVLFYFVWRWRWERLHGKRESWRFT